MVRRRISGRPHGPRAGLAASLPWRQLERQLRVLRGVVLLYAHAVGSDLRRAACAWPERREINSFFRQNQE